jgi:hypothetical protein
MSDFTVVQKVNERLKNLIFDGMTGEAANLFTGIGPDGILIGSPKEATDPAIGAGTRLLSLFLYQITEDPYLKNRPPVRVNGGLRLRPPPLALRLHYLITPVARNPEANALLIGNVLQVLYDTTTIRIDDATVTTAATQREDIRVVFETLSIAELAEVWEALKEPYRLSLAYQVRVPELDSRREMSAVPVGEQISEYGDVPPQPVPAGSFG